MVSSTLWHFVNQNATVYIQLIQLRLFWEGQKSKPQNLDLQARKAFWDIN